MCYIQVASRRSVIVCHQALSPEPGAPVSLQLIRVGCLSNIIWILGTHKIVFSTQARPEYLAQRPSWVKSSFRNFCEYYVCLFPHHSPASFDLVYPSSLYVHNVVLTNVPIKSNSEHFTMNLVQLGERRRNLCKLSVQTTHNTCRRLINGHRHIKDIVQLLAAEKWKMASKHSPLVNTLQDWI